MEKKLRRLEILDKALIVLTVVVGVVTVMDIFFPDPIFLLDEAALASLTGLLTYLSTIVKKEIEDIKNGKKTKVTTKEIGEITNKVSETAAAVKKSRSK